MNNKSIGIVGGGISGVACALFLIKQYPDVHIDIFEKNDKLLKKIYATGNGKCNFANSGELIDKYKNEDFVLPIIKDFGYKELNSYLNSIGVATKLVGSLAYPYSETALTVANALLKELNLPNIKIHLSVEVLDYQNTTLLTNLGTFSFDKVIFTSGGKSSPQLGSNGVLFYLFKMHDYELEECFPSLCPIKVKENVKRLDGLRNKVAASLYQDNKLIHQEEGELLFKKDGLSGIVIFNLTAYINRLKDKHNIVIEIDFAKGQEVNAYDSYLHPAIAKYLLDNHLDIHHTQFHFKDFYPFNNAQVTSGGIKLNQVSKDLSSKLEPNIYFAGEVLDVDAVCGGYNIMWAFASAYHLVKNIK